MDMPSPTSVLQSKKEKLRRVAVEGKWKGVIEMYREDERLHAVEITSSGDTAMHLAVSDGNVEAVAEPPKWWI